MRCESCSAKYDDNRKFCGECGAGLAVVCRECGTTAQPGMRFCGECGGPLGEKEGSASPTAIDAAPAPGASIERRIVSVLFADLVGFTTMSEQRDSEEMRALLTTYFDLCRTIIARYGGVVEKFIGDAVMAVWGTPVAQEDDAERAVRAAIDIVAGVAGIASSIGEPEFRLRAGVLTGEAAVDPAALAEGMVIGDLVNTASRIQSAAQPGSVFVGESTRRASDAGIVYEDAGVHQLKGKAEPVALWRALRVVGGVGGTLTSQGLETPLAGRSRELNLVKELLHYTAEERKAHLVLVTGIAGVGKSRLAWEFEKYVDGVADRIFWHKGRCPSYGDGVTYWALAEMIRMRARIVEGDNVAAAMAKLRVVTDKYIPDPSERRWVEPKLAQLLGLEEGSAAPAEELFGAWRLFFERLADLQPTVLVFEDLQWANPSLLAFIEHLLDWSRSHPILVVALARPELTDIHPEWAANRRNFTSLFLEPLSDGEMTELLEGLAPGLPEALSTQIRQRAEGVPLYAVETVRMMMDRGTLVRRGDQYVPTGELDTLEVPETLQALVGARLDSLKPNERRLLQDASVLGRSFTKGSLAELSAVNESAVEAILATLVRKEILALQSDPRSPTLGQYSFLQDLLRRVAYDRLSRKDRRARHLTVASRFQERLEFEGEDLCEVAAAHYLEAVAADPGAPDAPEVQYKAAALLARSGKRAGSLGAPTEALRFMERAAELSADAPQRAEYLDGAAEMAILCGDPRRSADLFREAIGLYREQGLSRPAARASARLGWALHRSGQGAEAIPLMEDALRELEVSEPDETVVTLVSQLAGILTLDGQLDRALVYAERALALAESLALEEQFVYALTTRGTLLQYKGRPREAVTILQAAVERTAGLDPSWTTLRAYNNLADTLIDHCDFSAARALLRKGIELAQRLGHRIAEAYMTDNLVVTLESSGEWDEASTLTRGLIETQILSFGGAITSFVQLLCNRGEIDAARSVVESLDTVRTTETQMLALGHVSRASLLFAEGEYEDAFVAASEAASHTDRSGPDRTYVTLGLTYAMEAAFASGNIERVQAILDRIAAGRPGDRGKFISAQCARFAGLVAVTRGDLPQAQAHLEEAESRFRALDMPFWLAVTLLNAAEVLDHDRKPALIDESRQIFTHLHAAPWLDRLSLIARQAAEVPISS